MRGTERGQVIQAYWNLREHAAALDLSAVRAAKTGGRKTAQRLAALARNLRKVASLAERTASMLPVDPNEKCEHCGPDCPVCGDDRDCVVMS